MRYYFSEKHSKCWMNTGMNLGVSPSHRAKINSSFWLFFSRCVLLNLVNPPPYPVIGINGASRARKAFGKFVSEQSVWHERIANARINIEMTRLLTLKAAFMMDTVGNKAARMEIAMIKVAGPDMAVKVFDDAIQAFGGAGVTDDADLADQAMWMRALRILDGPDEVHRNQIAKLELRRQLA
jgi:hypothetical protein